MSCRTGSKLRRTLARLRRIVPRVMGGIACAALMGCQAVTSEPFTDEAIVGVPYSLPTALVTLQFAKEGSAVTVGSAPGTDNKPLGALYIPDRQAHFVLQYHETAFANDRLCVTRSSSGFLSSVQFASDDATDEVLIKLAELAAKLVLKQKVGPGLVAPETTTVQFDPLDKAEQERAQKILEDKGFGTLTFEVPEFQKQIDAKTPPAICRGDAVCFRERVVTPLVVRDAAGNVGQTYITVADKWNLGRIRITRPFLVEEVTKIGFDQSGFLTSLSINRPSEAVAAAQLPLDIIDTILAVPGNFLGRAFGSFADRKALLAEQAELAKAKPTPEAKETDTNFTLQCASFKTEPAS